MLQSITSAASGVIAMLLLQGTLGNPALRADQHEGRHLLAMTGTVPAVIPPGGALASMYYNVKKGSKFTVAYSGGSEPLQALALPPSAMFYTADNKPNCYIMDPSLFRGPQGPALFIQGTFHPCDTQPYFNGTIQSGKPLTTKKFVIWALVNPNTVPVNVTMWRIMPTRKYRLPAEGAIMIVFCVALLAIVGAEYLNRKRKRASGTADDAGIQLEVVPQAAGAQPPQ